MVDVKVASGNLLDGVEEEMDEMIGGQPFTQIAGQEHWRLAVEIDEAGRHETQSQPAGFCSNNFDLFLSAVKSDKFLDTEKARKEIGCLENNLARMTYGTFRKAGYFIGSGVIEAGCKTVVGQRMKASGMFWSEEGGQAILDLRCAFLSNRLDAFWLARANDHAARNDVLSLAA